MNIAIIGYGRMGREIERYARDLGHEICAIVDPIADGATHTEISAESLGKAEVAIDFTNPASAAMNIEKMARLGVNMVVGTTGWIDQIHEIREIIDETGTGFIYAPNFSIGINLFYEIVKNSSRLFNHIEEYDVFCHEWHHKGKVDSPSGTAKKIADTLVSEIKRKNTSVFECLNRKREEKEMHFSSTRGGWVPGTHEVVFDSEFDSIELIHRTRNRGGLAMGALRAAEWIKGKKGFYEFADYLKEILDS